MLDFQASRKSLRLFTFAIAGHSLQCGFDLFSTDSAL
jgi:hypothetical protein